MSEHEFGGDSAEHQQARRRMDELFRALIENGLDVITILDAEGVIRYQSPSVERVLGYRPPELVGANIVELLHPDDVPKVNVAITAIAPPNGTPGIAQVVEARLRHKDGSWRIFESMGKALPSGLPVTGIAINSRDITERKQAEEALRESEEKYRTILESIEEAYFEVDLKGNFTFFNDSLSVILGYSQDELMGKNNCEYMPPRTSEEMLELFNGIYMTGKPVRKHGYEVIKKDGTHGFHELAASLMLDENDKPIGFRAIAHDITALKRAQEELQRAYDELERRVADRTQELRRANEELQGEITERIQAEEEIKKAKTEAEAANRVKSDFLASMSHELRTPLNAIIGFSELLQDRYFGELNEKQADYMNDILESGKHLLSLISDILDLSKIEAGKLDLQLSVVSVKELLENSLRMVREKCIKQGIDLSMNMAQGLDSLEITADERRLKQVMFNLLSNAAKFTSAGGAITVEGEQKGERIIISVGDTGIGIPLGDQEKIFEEFYQVKGSVVDKTAGTGLGLSVTRLLVEMHGGEIWVESEGEGKGSKFSFTLPLIAEPRKEIGLPEAQSSEVL